MPKPKYWDVWRSVRDTKQEFNNNQVKAALKASGLSKLQGVPLDSTYWGVSLETWHLILAYNGTDKKRYVKDTFDCDNFAILFAGSVADKFSINGAGIVIDYSGGHAYSALLVVTEDGSLAFATIEPQNDEFVIKMDGMYDAEFGFIMLA